MVLLGDNMALPGDNLVLPDDNMALPGDNLVLPGDNMVLPGDNMALPGDNMVLPGDNMALPGENKVFMGDNMALLGDMGLLGNNMALPGDMSLLEDLVALPGDNVPLPGEKLVTDVHLIGEQTEVMQQEQPIFVELLPAENGDIIDLGDLDVNTINAIYGLVQKEDNGVNPILEEGDGVNMQFFLDTNNVTLSQEADANQSTFTSDQANMDEDCMKHYVSPAEVCGEKVKSKRGRKRKYPEGQRPKRQRGSKKPKVYELEPLEDPAMEKKRLYALNAKKHRDMKKKEKEDLQNQLKTIIAERDQLIQLVETLKRRESTIQAELESFRAINIPQF